MRAYNEIFPSDRLELKKDAVYPGKYHRAGIIKTVTEWELIFPGSTNTLHINEWFINHTAILENEKFKINTIDLIRDETDYIFKQMGLNSISYKEATRKVINSLIDKKIITLCKI